MNAYRPAEIRLAAPADAAEITRIHLASRAATMPYLPPQRRTHDQVTAWVRDVVLADCRVWVALRGPAVVGYAAVAGDWLEHLYLDPAMLRQGIGTVLLDEVKRYRPEGVSLHVFQQNALARSFYARHGFEIAETGDGSGNMEQLPDLVLRWSPRS